MRIWIWHTFELDTLIEWKHFWKRGIETWCFENMLFWNMMFLKHDALTTFRHILAHSGTFWQILAHPGTFWHILANSGTFWHILAHSCTFWHILAHFGTFWHILEHSGTFWHNMAHSGPLKHNILKAWYSCKFSWTNRRYSFRV